jgi:Ca2+-binding RTX toxin-like protein
MRPDEHRGARAPRLHSKWPRIARAGGAAAAFLLAAPAASQAATASVFPAFGLAEYRAGDGERIEPVVTAAADRIVFTDQVATIEAGAGCTVDDPPAAHIVSCPATDVFDLQIYGADGNDVIRVEESLYAATTIEIVQPTGGAGADTIVTGSGTDVVFGMAGDDTLDTGGGVDNVRGDAGADTLAGGSGDDDLDGGPGADTLLGGEGDDALDGGLEDERGSDSFSGGAGSDALSYANRTSPLVVSVDGQPNDGALGEGDNVAGDIESIVAGSESDTLTGGGGAERLDGGNGDDLIDGGGGDDTVLGGLDSGSDGLSGGDGNDMVRGAAGDDSLAGGPGTDDLGAGGGSDALMGDGGDDVLAGGPGLDALDGGDGNDTLRGGDIVLVGADGADDIVGGLGDDAILGGPGNDTLDGGLGADSLRGEAGRDTVTYQDRSTPVTVTLDDLPNDGEAGEADNVASDIEAVVGGAVGDTLRGNPAPNDLGGGSGSDYIDPAAGVDTISGGSARDALRSRDGTRDNVSCGGGRDFAIVDPADVVRDCERVDDGTQRRPVAKRDAIVAATRGQLSLRLPGTPRFIPVQERLVIPLRATVDARRGTARVVTAATRRAPIQAGTFTSGRFRVDQTRGRRPVTVLRLTGGNLGRCPRAGATWPGAAYAAQAPRRRLWGRVGKRRGRYRTRGNHSSGTVRGTVWLTEDRCDGTLTRVARGTVAVRDFGLRRTVLVRAGEGYLARRR